MFGSKEEPYPVLISFWCDYDNKNLYFILLRFRILADISVLFIFGYYQNLVI